MRDLSWQDRAACNNDPAPDDWFEGTQNVATRARTLAVCFGCPVRDECLAFHLTIERDLGVDPVGTAGGMTAPERKRLAS